MRSSFEQPGSRCLAQLIADSLGGHDEARWPRHFLYFHDDPSGIFADVRLAKGFVRLPVTSSSQQSDLLDRIGGCLSTIESRGTKRRRQQARWVAHTRS